MGVVDEGLFKSYIKEQTIFYLFYIARFLKNQAHMQFDELCIFLMYLSPSFYRTDARTIKLNPELWVASNQQKMSSSLTKCW